MISRSRHVQATLLKPSYPEMPKPFRPAYTPIRMLRLGVFGNNYFADADADDFSQMKSPLVKLAQLNVEPYSRSANCFGARAGLNYSDWMLNGWIFDEDPLGWFHWYCRYYSGRRHSRDTHQVQRWMNYKQRWGDRAWSQLNQRGSISAVVMQGLLQWSIDPYLGND